MTCRCSAAGSTAAKWRYAAETCPARGSASRLTATCEEPPTRVTHAGPGSDRTIINLACSFRSHESGDAREHRAALTLRWSAARG